MTRLPRIVVAAPASGHGKTTVATGLMAALRARGLDVSGHKVGPDYIDPGYHALATGRPGRNLDAYLLGEHRLVPLLLHGAATPRPADVAVIEGVMGLFDGQLGREGFASTAHVASVVQAPVVLVVDVSHASRSIAAVVHGMVTFDPDVRVRGVVLNKVGSARHGSEVVSALEATGVPVLGLLPRDAGIEAPARHLGLVPAAERDDAAASLERLSVSIAEEVDLDAVLAIAGTAPDLDAAAWDASTELGPPPAHERPVVAVAGGRAFTFRYAETEELLRAGGCEPVVFDPALDEALPTGTAGIYLGGGFPEMHAGHLGANSGMRAHLRAAVAAGVPTVAECAGLLYLCTSLDGTAMVGALDATAVMSPRLTLAYRSAVAGANTLLAPAGARVTGHEFHRTTVTPPTAGEPAWLVDGKPAGFDADPAGTGSSTVDASYLHVHWAGHPSVARRFVAAVHEAAADGRVAETPAARPVRSTAAPVEVDLHHHGDREITPGLVDLAVNVSTAPRPVWLQSALERSLQDLASYPRSGEAEGAVALRHRRPVDDVLLTAGAAEAFTLLARCAPWRRPVVVHPQFTEPEAALRAAGHGVQRVLLGADAGFALEPGAVPDAADLVVLGNPTNPTGVLHSKALLRALLRPGRIVVVDEAFMDAVPGEQHSLAGERTEGLVVVRSITKTWAVPGLRAGYVVGDPEVLRAMRDQQPPWSVSTPARSVVAACCTPTALAEAAARARTVALDRSLLVEGLAAIGLPVTGEPAGPFVLVDTAHARPPGTRPGHVRDELRTAGFAVRRGDTFPGLGADWVRVTVRSADTTRRLLDALEAVLGCRA